MSNIRQGGEYALFNGVVYRIDSASFVTLGKDDEHKFALWGDDQTFLFNEESMVDSAYHVENWCTVDGFKLRITNCLNGVYYLMVDEKNEAMVKHFGVKPTGYDYLSTAVGKKDEEILDIWELRTPIKGFPFREPSEVYLKFDGEWLI